MKCHRGKNVFIYLFNSVLIPVSTHTRTARCKYPPENSSYLIGEVHNGPLLDQFPDNPHVPIPSSHHDGCLPRFLHGIQGGQCMHLHNTQPRSRCLPKFIICTKPRVHKLHGTYAFLTTYSDCFQLKATLHGQIHILHIVHPTMTLQVTWVIQ